MSHKITDWVWGSPNVDGKRLLALLALASYADDEGFCFPGVKTLAGKLRVTERQAMRILSNLENDGFITITKRGNGRGNINVFKINTEMLAAKILQPDALNPDMDDTFQEKTLTPMSPISAINPDIDVTLSAINPDIQREETLTSSALNPDILGNLSIYKNQYDPLKENSSNAPAPAAQSVSEFPVSKNTLGIKAVRITEPVTAQSVEIFDPPSSAEIRLQAAQRRIVEAPVRATKLPKLDTPHVTQQISADGYLPAGSGKTAVEVYAERFSLTNPETRLTMPLQDDLVRDCPDLDRLRTVLVAYSQTSYKPRNMKLILDWYRTGVPAHKQQQGATANATISRPVTPQPGTGQGNLGKAARVGREEAKRLFAHLPMYQTQEKNQ